MSDSGKKVRDPQIHYWNVTSASILFRSKLDSSNVTPVKQIQHFWCPTSTTIKRPFLKYWRYIIHFYFTLVWKDSWVHRLLQSSLLALLYLLSHAILGLINVSPPSISLKHQLSPVSFLFGFAGWQGCQECCICHQVAIH